MGSEAGLAACSATATPLLRYADGRTLSLDRRTAVMGVLNVNPDSFFDGGRFERLEDAIEAGLRMEQDGADLIDVGGESTRPGACPIDAELETRRVLPVIEALKRRTRTRVSVDTSKPVVARRALDAGADLINDVSGGGDPEMLPLVAGRGVPLVLMHMRGTPRTMQQDTRYDDLMAEIVAFLDERARAAIDAGITQDRIAVDPGIGFGKSCAGNLTIVDRIPELVALGYPVLIGASRKTFIGKVLDLPPDGRLHGSLAVAAIACVRGARIIRAHDVAATVQAVRMTDAIRQSGH